MDRVDKPPTAGQLLNNGLTPEQNDQAVKCIQKLKVHDLSSIISQINIRRPRASKPDQQKALYSALFDQNHSGTVWRMAVQLSQPSYDSKRHGMPTANRNHPYPRPNGVMNGNMMHQNYQSQQLFQQHMYQQHQQLQQQHQQHQHPVQQRTFAPRFDIVPLPFYDVIATLMEPVELHATMNGAKSTKQLQFTFQMTNDQVQKIYRNEANPLPRYEVQLRFYNITDLGQVSGPLKDDFPLNAGVRVNEQQVTLPHVIPTNKPNVEPKRPSRPVNITPQLWRLPAVHHKIVFDWLGDRRCYAAAITFVHRVNADILFERIDKNPLKHKSIELTKREVCDKLNGTGEEDIAMDHLRISLLDPLIKSRMITPSRCMDCTHLQCFDLSSYLKMNEKKPTWQCPVCSSYCPYDRLIVDDYFLDMLAKVDKSTTEVELKSDGSYDVIGVDDEVCLSDDDDDEVKPMTNGQQHPCSSTNGSGSGGSGGSEPPQNGGKRKLKMGPPADEDIIVLSDDDDDELTREPVMKTPPRPVKNGKSTDAIEIITLDDTPPRPMARQMSLQQPSSSSSTSGAATSSSAAMPTSSSHNTLSDALASIGGSSNTNGSSSGRVSFNFDQHPGQQQQQQHMQTSYQAVQAAHAAQAVSQQQHQQQQQQSAAAAAAAQYGYPPLHQQSLAQQQQQYQMQQQLIGRANQMGQMQQQQQAQQAQQGQQGMMAANYYGQQGYFGFQPAYPQQYRQN